MRKSGLKQIALIDPTHRLSCPQFVHYSDPCSLNLSLDFYRRKLKLLPMFTLSLSSSLKKLKSRPWRRMRTLFSRCKSVVRFTTVSFLCAYATHLLLYYIDLPCFYSVYYFILRFSFVLLYSTLSLSSHSHTSPLLLP